MYIYYIETKHILYMKNSNTYFGSALNTDELWMVIPFLAFQDIQCHERFHTGPVLVKYYLQIMYW